MLQVVIRLRRRIGVEGVGLDDVRPRLQVRGMNIADNPRLGEREQIVVAFEVVRKIGKAAPPIIAFSELVALDHRAHGAIQNQDAPLEQLFE